MPPGAQPVPGAHPNADRHGGRSQRVYQFSPPLYDRPGSERMGAMPTFFQTGMHLTEVTPGRWRYAREDELTKTGNFVIEPMSICMIV
ncbi:hypothetical protein N7520_005323 [Penicillium odoratum]|uniref:uncharacterized protein n=1 Tax=Penicillium odoratum TaxID=1167516 RepID=UPI002548918B|nr:uncharacterized protein N7520_005323 [Penicillium odoratum]KAJ5765764.1 hypothetical protein N7520_005323 [Penicillium odoratum]